MRGRRRRRCDGTSRWSVRPDICSSLRGTGTRQGLVRRRRLIEKVRMKSVDGVLRGWHGDARSEGKKVVVQARGSLLLLRCRDQWWLLV